MSGYSLVIPFYNEEAILSDSLRRIWDFASTYDRPFEILLADDGSTDGSGGIAERFLTEHPASTKLVRNETNRGRGSVLTQAFTVASMPILAYLDADLEIDLPFLRQLLLRFDDPTVSVSTGSKLTTQQPYLRARHRKVASLGFNFLVQRMLHSPVSDHQCGLKGVRREVFQAILPDIRETGWAWDTEVLLLLQKRGHRIDEFPVELHSRRKSTVPFLATVCMFFRKIFALRRRGLAL